MVCKRYICLFKCGFLVRSKLRRFWNLYLSIDFLDGVDVGYGLLFVKVYLAR